MNMKATDQLDTDADADDEFFGENGNTKMRVCGTLADNTIDDLTTRDDGAMKQRHKNFGYHESYEQYHNIKLQDGFVTGYQETYVGAFRIGEMLGRLAFMSFRSTGVCRVDSHEHKQVARRVREVLESITVSEDSNNTSTACMGNERFTAKEQLQALEREIGLR